MLEQFAGYYRRSEAQWARIWRSCLFTLDSNVLLNLYRYSEATRDDLLKVLGRLAPRLWIAHQAALEFHRNRPAVIASQVKAYAEAQAFLKETGQQVVEQFASPRHPFVERHLLRRMEDVLEAMRGDLESRKHEREKLFDQDPLLEDLTELLKGRVGQPFSEAEVAAIQKEGRARYKHQVPPGFGDVRKRKEYKYGDLILWRQVLLKAMGAGVPVVLVTDDVKDDWWWEVDERQRVLGPRPELFEEMKNSAGVDFYMFDSGQFLEISRQQLNLHVAADSLEEIKQAHQQDRKPPHAPEKAPPPSAESAVDVKLKGLAATMQRLTGLRRQIQGQLQQRRDSGAATGAGRLAAQELQKQIALIDQQVAQTQMAIDELEAMRSAYRALHANAAGDPPRPTL